MMKTISGALFLHSGPSSRKRLRLGIEPARRLWHFNNDCAGFPAMPQRFTNALCTRHAHCLT